MAITFTTDKLQGLPSAVAGVYGRIQSVTVKKYDTDPVSWQCLYDVILHSSAGVRNADGEYPGWSNRIVCQSISHFTCTYDPTSNSNPYAQAYADLKTKLAADDPPLATSIADA